MSANYAGVTFVKQKITPVDDAIIRRALLTDGILTGCALTYSGYTLTMAAGQLMVSGRQIRHPSAENWAINNATSGFARVLLTIDLTRTATKTTFDQVNTSVEYATSATGFPSLQQDDINANGSIYQVALAVVSLGTGGITGITSKLEPSEAAGGAGAVNFKVVGGLTQPADAEQNLLWVNTSVPITSVLFCSEASIPSATTEGAVVVKCSWTTSTVQPTVRLMGEARSNRPAVELRFRITSVSQIINTIPTPMDAKIYINNSWRTVSTSWDGYLFKDGEQYAAQTGGWTASGYPNGASAVARVSDTLRVESPNVSNLAYLGTDSAVDLTNVNSVHVQSPGATGFAYPSYVQVRSAKTGVHTATVQVAAGERTIDVSGLSGSYYICLYASGGSAGRGGGVVSQIWLT